MADRYQDRPFPADDGYDRGEQPHPSSRADSDPLAELARLIGQTDPFAGMGRANQPVPPRGAARDPYPPEPEPEPEDSVAAGPPPWMQRAAIRQEAPPPEVYPSAVHPLKRYATPPLAAAVPEPEPEYDPPPFAEADYEPDPSRYDDALYGQLEAGAEPAHHDAAYPDDPYGYQDGYDDGAEQAPKKRRGGLIAVVGVLALAVVGTGAAYAYRNYVGSPRSGEPPIIRADSSPTKIVPAPADASGKVPDRLAAGDGAEKIVPREEAPVDVNAAARPAGPRMVFPPLNQNANPPTVASVAPSAPMPPATGGNGTLPNNEPHKIKTLTVRGDQPDAAATPITSAAPPPAAAKPAPRAAAAPRPSPANANASAANAPLSLSPQAAAQPAPAADTRTRLATNSPVPITPAASPTTTASGGGYLVQVSSQKNEADAQASYRVLQGKYPSVLGSQSVLVKRVDLGEKGVYYRAFAGPFSSADQAAQLCNSLKAAGGPQCLIQRN